MKTTTNNKTTTTENTVLTGLRGTTAAYAAKLLARDLLGQENVLALEWSPSRQARVIAMREELSDLERAAKL